MSVSAPLIFDRRLCQERRRYLFQTMPDVLHNRFLEILAERLLFTKRRFTNVLIMGLPKSEAQKLFTQYTTPPLLFCLGQNLIADEEFLPFANQSFDLVISFFQLHWINDLPGVLLQIRHFLQSDGLFFGALFGENTLKELRQSLWEAEYNLKQGIYPRVSPMIQVKDGGSLLQRAGFSMPVVDCERLTLLYNHPLELMKDLQFFGQNNALDQRQKTCASKSVFKDAIAWYQKNYLNNQGKIKASIDALFLSGWSPSPTQQKSLPRGSGAYSLKNALEV